MIWKKRKAIYLFDFEFFQNNNLINKFENLLYENEVFITDDISYNHREKLLVRETEDNSIIIDLNAKNLFLRTKSINYEGNISLKKANVSENNNIIEITYQIDDNEPIYKILITRR